VRLLLAIDTTDSDDVVVSQVASRPWPYNTVASVLTVIEYAAVPSDVWQEAGGRTELVRLEMERSAEGVIEHAISELTAAGIKAESMIRDGDPRFEIVDAATNWPADLVFVRSHVFKSLTRWLLGSVSKTVLREAPCSVEIVRATRGDAEQQARGGMKILLATDGSDYSMAAASSVAARPWPDNSEVKVVSATDPLGYSAEVVREPVEESDGREEIFLTPEEKAVHDAKEIVSLAGLKTTGAVLGGYPKAAIVDEAKEWGADLVVVGSHGRRGIERILLGSVSEAVALHAHCSVEVIRSRALSKSV
jgi:nucleotide-binding universal stress UspA family protein